jgi:3-hydroxyisobutyrate dehydrogenase-like beta-hydroxyacid dehydrogenase
MVGGDRDAYERAKPVFEQWATLVVHLGPPGAATRTKLARNMMHFVAYTAAFESQRLAEAAGIDLRKLASVVRHSDAVTGGASAIMVRDATGVLAPDDGLHDIFVHTRGLAEKDLTLAMGGAPHHQGHAPVVRWRRAQVVERGGELGGREVGHAHSVRQAGSRRRAG